MIMKCRLCAKVQLIQGEIIEVPQAASSPILAPGAEGKFHYRARLERWRFCVLAV